MGEGERKKVRTHGKDGRLVDDGRVVDLLKDGDDAEKGEHDFSRCQDCKGTRRGNGRVNGLGRDGLLLDQRLDDLVDVVVD